MTPKSFWQGGDTMLFPSKAPFANATARKTSVNCKKYSLFLLSPRQNKKQFGFLLEEIRRAGE